MRTKKYLGLLTAICFSLCLAGCGEAFPELTEDEYDQTVEFAVGLLMKYSNITMRFSIGDVVKGLQLLLY